MRLLGILLFVVLAGIPIQAQMNHKIVKHGEKAEAVATATPTATSIPTATPPITGQLFEYPCGGSNGLPYICAPLAIVTPTP